jgi:glutamine phosphoribosylpyrophosphate amidotransferase
MDGMASQVGADLLTMAACIQHRGSDSAGFAVFGEPVQPARLHVMLADTAVLPEPQAVYSAGQGMLTDLTPLPSGFWASIREDDISPAELSSVARRIEAAVPGATVTASGKRLAIQKTLGTAENLAQTVGAMSGTHGIAHLRLATESRIDPAHAQPFWARGFYDIAVTHNGHITNYHKMRQRFEARGYSFGSSNDSEIIGIFLGDKMAEGLSFKESLESASRDLDGSFSFIAATKDGLGVARDAFATKPLLYTEVDGTVALASEQQALHHLLGEDIVIREIQPKETRTWEIA